MVNLAAARADDARQDWSTAQLEFRDADAVLEFASSLPAGDRQDPVSKRPTQLLLGQQITLRDPPLSSEQFTTILHMLHRLTHLELLAFEDGDGLFHNIPAASRETPLSLPKLKTLSYRMLFAAEYCNTFLASLRDAPLNSLQLVYPEDGIDPEQTHPPDLVLMLSHPCLANLVSLEASWLVFEYLGLPSTTRAPQFPAMRDLALIDIGTLDNTCPRRAILGFLLTLFPNLTSLEIQTPSGHALTPRTQTVTLENVKNADLAAQKTAGTQRRLALSSITASLLDIYLLDVPCHRGEMDITGIDLWTLNHAGEELMRGLFRGLAPRSLSIRFRQSISHHSPLGALFDFLRFLEAYWEEFSQRGIPETIKLYIDIKELADVGKSVVSLALYCDAIQRSWYKSMPTCRTGRCPS